MRNMPSFSIGASARFALVAVVVMLLAACHHGATKPNEVQAANIPSSFDLTLLADKDNQFDFDGAPLTTEDLKSAFRYRQEQSLPMSTVLLKPGEKEKVTDRNIIDLARIAYELKFKAYVLNKNGEISQVEATAKGTPASNQPPAETTGKHP